MVAPGRMSRCPDPIRRSSVSVLLSWLDCVRSRLPRSPRTLGSPTAACAAGWPGPTSTSTVVERPLRGPHVRQALAHWRPRGTRRSFRRRLSVNHVPGPHNHTATSWTSSSRNRWRPSTRWPASSPVHGDQIDPHQPRLRATSQHSGEQPQQGLGAALSDAGARAVIRTLIGRHHPERHLLGAAALDPAARLRSYEYEYSHRATIIAGASAAAPRPSGR